MSNNKQKTYNNKENKNYENSSYFFALMFGIVKNKLYLCSVKGNKLN